MSQNIIELKEISKTYGDNTVLNNLSLNIKKNEFLTLLGPSGCGKTTTLKIIAGFENADEGVVLFGDNNITSLPPYKRKLNTVFQKYALFPHMNIYENIAFGLKIKKLPKAEIDKKVKNMLKLVALEGFEKRSVESLSGGQQQRVGVARAFANDPDIILMDEPFSALDPITRSDLQDELVELQSKLKKTIVFVTHDMDEAIKISDMICIMKDGEVLQYDTPENILRNPVDDFVSNFVGKNRIWASPEYIKISDIMIDKPVTAYKELSVFKCLDKMRQKKVDSLLIIDPSERKLLGIVKASRLRSVEDKTQPVESLMNVDFPTLVMNESILDALKIVTEEHISTVPVVGDNNCLLGLITKSSLVTTLSQQYFDFEEEQVI